MDPRLKSSTKWSPFPEELCQQIQEALSERFADEYDLNDGTFIVEGRIYSNEILARIGLNIPKQLKQPNIELSFEYDPKEKEQTLEMIQNSMDVIEHIWSEFLEDDMEDGEMPRQWQTMPFEKVMYFFKYSTFNSTLESEADKWLKENDTGLFNESSNEEELMNTSPEELSKEFH